jgi:predicted helicase
LKNKKLFKIENDKFIKCSYRPFDDRYTYFDNKILWRWRVDVMQHFLKGENLGLAVGRQGVVTGSPYWDVLSITKNVMDFNYYRRGGEVVFPLYLYPETNAQQIIGQTHTSTSSLQGRTPNLNPEIVKQIAEKLGLTFVPEKNKDTELVEVAPIDILDYIYAVLHSPTYREKNKEFLKIDFPRVPYPKDKDTFWKLVKLGGEIRQIHLLESPIVERYITQYPIDGDNVVRKSKYENGKVYINDTQYFANVPQIAWDFYIGGYQPAQKWLKDRKDRKLEFDDILHYQKIIVALTETDRLMNEIHTIEIE